MIRAAFIHVPKTGGTSIKAMFGGLLFNLHHKPLSAYREAFEAKHDESWDDLYKFAFVRNPWARYASFYQHHLYAMRNRGVMDDEFDFAGFIEKVQTTHLREQNPHQILHNAENVMDQVSMFEHFDAAVWLLSENMGVQLPAMQHLNRSQMPKVADWRPFYIEKTHDAVAELGKWEIEHFGYTFDDCAMREVA